MRERPKDILALANHFADKYAETNALPRRELSQAAIDELLRHSWQGNVRELENNMHRAVLLCSSDEIEPGDMMLGDQAVGMGADHSDAASAASAAAQTTKLVGRTVADVERDLIIDTLRHCLGNRTHAANILGISIRTLRNKLKLYDSDGISVPPSTADARMANA